MKKIAICGAGGHGAEIQTILEDINEEKPAWDIIGYYDPGLPKGEVVRGLPVLGSDGDLLETDEQICVAIAVGNIPIRVKIYEKLSRNSNLSFPTLVHPLAYIARDAELGEGCVVFPFAMIWRGASLGKMVFVGGGAQVSHHVTVGDYSMLMPHAIALGNTRVGKNVLLGANSTVLQGVSIDDGAAIGMGSVVLRDVREGVTAVGNPARVIKADGG